VVTRIRLDVAYDGTDFKGWSRQPGLRTVQGELESALATIFRRCEAQPTLSVAGRTDAGVHARGQVAHLDLDDEQLATLARSRRGDSDRTAERTFLEADTGAALGRRLNGILGASSDIVVTRGSVAPAGFDARFSAVWRRYEYRIADRVVARDPLRRFGTLWYPSELDEAIIAPAAASLLGLHDFASYCKPREGATTIRTLQEFRWRRDADGVLIADLQADAFCHSMVRALVGACVAVGEGKLAAKDLALLRDVGERTNAFKVMPAKGLTLIEVGYPDDSDLARRAEQTRSRRTLETTGILETTEILEATGESS
jgi:tRNA pseudouridine38-40 synthase